MQSLDAGPILVISMQQLQHHKQNCLLDSAVLIILRAILTTQAPCVCSPFSQSYCHLLVL